MLWIKKNLNCYQLHRSIMVFMELVYMVLNSDANWLNNSDECYKLKCNYGNARTTWRLNYNCYKEMQCGNLTQWHKWVKDFYSVQFSPNNCLKYRYANSKFPIALSNCQIFECWLSGTVKQLNGGGGITLLSMLCRVYPWQLTWSRDQ